MHQHHQRAQLLISQGRYELAETELGQILAKDPQDAEAHLMLSVCYKHSKKYKEATLEAQQAIQLQPDNSRCHLILASIFLTRNRYDEAEQAAKESLRLDPYDEDTYALLAQIHFSKKEWRNALLRAEEGLEIDPDHAGCLSLRSLAQERLGDGKIAVDSAKESLERNPDDSYAHATYAWSLLTKGQHKEAQESFREALRLDPTNEFAKQGMIKALNANNFIFKLVLKWYTFIGRMSGGMQWAIVLGLYFGNQILGQIAKSVPALGPFILPIMILYLVFCITGWIANPLFNTFLRFNRYGKYLLDNQQIMASNVMGGVIAFGLLLGIGLVFAIPDEPIFAFILGFGFSIIMLMPVSGMMQCEEGYPFVIMLVVTLLLASIGLFCLLLMALGYMPPKVLSYTFLFGILGSQFLANYLLNATVKH